jgi:hypothetical protein
MTGTSRLEKMLLMLMLMLMLMLIADEEVIVGKTLW